MKDIKLISLAALLVTSISAAYATESLNVHSLSRSNGLLIRVLLGEDQAAEGATVIHKSWAGKVIHTVVTSDSGYAFVPVQQDYPQLVYLDIQHGEHQDSVTRRSENRGINKSWSASPYNRRVINE